MKFCWGKNSPAWFVAGLVLGFILDPETMVILVLALFGERALAATSWLSSCWGRWRGRQPSADVEDLGQPSASSSSSSAASEPSTGWGSSLWAAGAAFLTGAAVLGGQSAGAI